MPGWTVALQDRWLGSVDVRTSDNYAKRQHAELPGPENELPTTWSITTVSKEFESMGGNVEVPGREQPVERTSSAGSSRRTRDCRDCSTDVGAFMTTWAVTSTVGAEIGF